MPAEQSNEKVKRWTLPVCTGCGGVIGLRGLDAGCSCPVDFAKIGKSVEVIPAASPQVLSVEEARLLREFAAVDHLPDEPLSEREREARAIFDRLSDFAEEADRG